MAASSRKRSSRGASSSPTLAWAIEDPNDPFAASGNPPSRTAWTPIPLTPAATRNNVTLHVEGEFAPLVTSGTPPYSFVLVDPAADADPENDFVHDTSDNRIQSLGEDVVFVWIDSQTIEGRTVDTDRLIFTLTLNNVTGHVEFDLNDQLDHPFVSHDDGTNFVGALEELLSINLSSVVEISDSAGHTVNLGDIPGPPLFAVGVIDDTPTAFNCVEAEQQEVTVIYEEHNFGSWSLTGSGSIVGDIGTTDPQPDPTEQALLVPEVPGESDLEAFFGLPFGSIAAAADDGDPSNGTEVPTNGSAIKQIFSVQAGDVLTVKFNFLEFESDGGDEGSGTLVGPTYQDFAFVVVGDQVFRLSDVSDANIPSNANGGQWSEDLVT